MNYVSYENMTALIDKIKEWVIGRLALKQDKLTPGQGVSITDDNVISTETNSVIEVNLSNYTDYLKKAQYQYIVNGETVTKEMRGWTLDTSKSNHCGTYYFTEEMKDIITPQQPIMRIGITEFEDQVTEAKMNGCRLTLGGWFKVGMFLKSRRATKVIGRGMYLEYYYSNVEYDTEIDTTLSEGIMKIIDEFDDVYIVDCSNRQHFIDLLCWKCKWFTKGYIK